MNVQPQQEHLWLNRLIGKWDFEGECSIGPGQPVMKQTGIEVVRSLGGLWTIGEGEGAMPEGGTAQSIMTLGFDPTAGRFVGSFITSVMTHLWIYNGSLDVSGKVLELDTEGPSLDEKGTQKYRDSIEFIDDDHRVLTSRTLDESSQWQVFMTAHYYRKK